MACASSGASCYNYDDGFYDNNNCQLYEHCGKWKNRNGQNTSSCISSKFCGKKGPYSTYEVDYMCPKLTDRVLPFK